MAEGKKTCMVKNGRKQIRTTFPDESEMVEEYDVQTDELLVRKRKTKTVLGRESEWVFEVGEAPKRITIEGDMMRESNANPALVRKDRPNAFEWRIRNLPYPKSTYDITIDTEKNQIVLRTSNKKYFKRISIEDMDRAGLKLTETDMQWGYENNTVIIQYKKPTAVIKVEKAKKVERHQLSTEKPAEEGAPECNQQ